MRAWRAITTLLSLMLVVLVAIGPATAIRAEQQATDGGAEGAQPATTPVGNNVVGLNVARLRKDRYIYAAAELVNANGGDWGYLTVVFTADERDGAHGEQFLQQLLDRCFEQHLQPIIRVATRFDVGTETWSRPEPDDAERWRAFLEKGRWPTKRVWVIAGNEPNLGREWGGEVDAASYAAYLNHFLDVFADSERFKVVNGPLDASNGTELPRMQDAYEFLAEMEAAVPGIFTRLAGWASNPYSVPHGGDGLRYTHRAYESELEAIGREMPVLITEAGHLNTGDEHEIAAFYEQAFRDWMADPRVVAVTPLFWHPDRGVYWMFDFDTSGKVVEKSPTYELIRRLPRPKGSPEYTPEIENVARGEQRPALPRVENVALKPAPAVSGATQADAQAAPSENASLPEEPTATPIPPTATPVPATPTPVPATATSVPPTATRPPATATAVPPTATPLPAAAPTQPPATALPVVSPPPQTGIAPPPAAGQTAPSGTAGARYMRIGNTDGGAVRLRGTPARAAPAIASVPPGTRVEAIGSSERYDDLHWQYVRVPDPAGTGAVAEGWIAIDFLIPE